MFMQSFVCTLFILIGIFNLIGTVTLYYTVTSQFVFTLSISFPVILMVIINGFIINGKYYFNNFLPNGVPLSIVWLIIPIELLSLTSRIISLAVRLSANVISGHTLTHMISGFTGNVLYGNISFGFDSSLLVFLLTFVLLFVLSFLEMGIAVLQSYVFSLLIVSYIVDSLSTH